MIQPLADPARRPSRWAPPALVAVIGAVLLVFSLGPADAAATFTVNKTGDAGDRRISDAACDTSRQRGKQCTLRAAIQEANDTLGGDAIRFQIGGPGVKTISPASPLPAISEAVTIDGYTQPGARRAGTFVSAPEAVILIQLNGTNAGAGANGLTVESVGSRIEGLAINRFEENGIDIRTPAATGNEVLGNYIGTNAAGETDLGNGENGVRVATDGNTVGGEPVAARNVISGNGDDGVEINGSDGNEVLGNAIGTNAAGTADLGNSRAGVAVFSAQDNTVGGTAAAARNVISGNEAAGVEVAGDTATNNEVLGNFVGTDTAGTADLGNTGTGISVSSADGNTIGGTVTGSRNVISGNGGDGVSLANEAASNDVQGNFIGTNVTGNAALGNSGDGVDISEGVGNTIGGTVGAARNVISANVGDGVVIFGTDATGNKVQGNFIGTGANGVIALGNDDGVVISSGNDSTIGSDIGGTAGGNRIANNQQDGVLIVGGAALGNSVLSNSIFANGEIGIDLGSEGVTANDTDDPDCTGNSNRCQNFPVITSAIRSNTTTFTTISGTLNSNPNQSLTVQCFVAAADTSGHGEGQIPVGEDTTVTTDSSGDANFSCPANPVPQAGQVVTATATNTATGDTSEFSQNVGVVAVP